MDLPSPIFRAPTTVISKNVLFYCGRSLGCVPLKAAYTFNVVTKEKCRKADMLIARESHAIVYHNGIVYAFGSTEAAEMFSSDHNVWTKLKDLPFMTSFTAASLYLDEIWVAGEVTYKASAFSIATQTHRVVDIYLSLSRKPYRFLINLGEILYIFTSNNNIMKVINREGEHSII